MLVGASPKRKEDGRFVAGHGRYLDDVQVEGLLHLAIVRSPHAHARVLGVDAEAARALPGVLAVWTLGDLPELATAITCQSFISPCSTNEPAATSIKLIGKGMPTEHTRMTPKRTGKP